LRKGFARGILKFAHSQDREIIQQSSCLYTYHLFLSNVCLVEPSQIVLSQVQPLKKAESVLEPLEAGINSGYVAM